MKRNLTQWAWFVAAFITAVLVHASAGAAVPATITQQGRLFNSSGAPVAGSLNITFAIYAVADQGASLWNEDLTVPVEDGYYSVRLGEATPFPATLFDGQTLFLGIKVGTDAEMTPRQPIVSVPYAFLAAEADHAATADTATNATTANSATTATNVTGAITPRSVSVNGSIVIDTNGNWVGAIPDRPFTSLTSALQGPDSAASSAGSYVSASISCPLGSVATGGGCYTGTLTHAALKSTNPTISGGKSIGWECTCAGMDTSGVCTVRAYAICATD